jgi:hypothetical protein
MPLEDVVAGARFYWSLPSYLRHPISLEEARATLRRRLERREADFLALARRAIYRHAGSPYRRLLELAGCEYGDLERLVGQEGVEGALGILFRGGVYLTVDEFKGRRPAVRGSATIAVDPGRLRNPGATPALWAQSGGSRGPRTPVPIDLAHVRDRAVNRRLVFDAWGAARWRPAVWEVPGGAVLVNLLTYCGAGARPARWFSQLDPSARGVDPRYRWRAGALRWGSALAAVPLPRPRYVPLPRPLPIARWMAGVLAGGETPLVHTYATSAVRLCQAALDAGIELRGARFTLGSEPTTAARLAVIHRAGAGALASYLVNEAGPIGHGCLAPEASDDLHAYHDFHALIQPGPDGSVRGLPPDALLLSSLRPTAPLMLLNVSLGDQAVVTSRACGCPMGRFGWATHLHTIRSFEKLTAGGMTFFDPDVIRVLEEVLPGRFGGGPTDYQLLEEEDDDGRPRLRLLVHPAVGPLEAEAVREAFLAAISRGPDSPRVMALQWRDAGFPQVERRPPLTTPAGKILHLHQHGRPADPPPG